MTAKIDRNGVTASLTQLPHAWFDAHSALSGTTQDIAGRWTKGITDQVQRNLDLCGNLAACQNVGEAMRLQERWLSETIDGVSTSIKDLQNLGTELSQRWMTPHKGNSATHARTPAAAA